MPACLIQTRGQSLLVDPVWAERASPFSFAGPKRVNPPGIAFDDLPKIDAVLVTHNHYDHMDVEHDRAAVAAVPPAHRHAARQRHDPQAGRAGARAPAPSTGTMRSISAAASPCMSSRRCTGRRAAPATACTRCGRASWCKSGGRKVYCVGDSGFGDGATFARVRRRHPRPRARPAADRRLRAALVHAQQPHEPGGGRRGAGAVRRGAGPRPPLGHVPPHQRGRRARRSRTWPPRSPSRSLPPERFPALRPGEVRVVA